MTEVTLPRGAYPASLVLEVIEELAQHGELYMRIGNRVASLPITEAEIADVLQSEPWWQVSVSAKLSDPESLVYVTNTSVSWQVDDADASIAAARVRRILGDPENHGVFPGSVDAPPLTGGVAPPRDSGLALLEPITLEERAGVENILKVLRDYVADNDLPDSDRYQILAVCAMIEETQNDSVPGVTERGELVVTVRRGLKWLGGLVPIPFS